MRHGKKVNQLGRTASHRKAMLSNMAASLILHKRIHTTVAKAKELRKYVEPLITRSKNDNTHSRRVVFSYLQDKESSKVLFDEISRKVADRNGGYTRIIKLGNRQGDNAEMCMMELVDYNELLLKEEAPAKSKSRRSRRRRGGSGKKSQGEQEGQETAAATTAGGATGAASAAATDATVEEEKESETESQASADESGETEVSSDADHQSAQDEEKQDGKEDEKDENKNQDDDSKKSE